MKAAVYIRVGKKEQLDYVPANNKPTHEHKNKKKKYTETAGAIIVMSIIGGAFMPAVQGFVSDMVGSMQFSFIVNFFCFAYIGWYFYYKMKLENKEG